jgi:hypothetical protein
MAEDADLVCWKCVEHPILRSWLRERGYGGTCSFCGKRRIACPLLTLAQRIDEVIREFYKPAKETAHVVAESDNPQYWADGTPANELIQEIAGVEPDLADAIDGYLSDLEQHDVRDGGDAYYDGVPLEHIDTFPEEFMETWRYLEGRLKHKVRFFDEEGKRLLDELFGKLSSLAGGKAILTVEPAGEFPVFYRARIVDGTGDIELFLRGPELHLGPPPPLKARAGRMNPVGIAVFYGAFSEEVAIAEVRPPVGAVVAVGKFSLLRSVRLLDLTALSFVWHTESIFSTEYGHLRNYVAFLEKIERRLARPVLPSDEALEYLPTQAFAAYVQHVMGLDGVVYRSTQVAGESAPFKPIERSRCNVVFFGRAARVESRVAPKANQDSPAVVPVTDPNSEAIAETQTSTWTAVLKRVRIEPEAFDNMLAEPASLRLAGEPQFVKIRAVAVEHCTLNASLMEDGSIFVNHYEDDESEL